ncbi:ATP10 protein expressed [Zea mays]|uniref:ATP10 protein expressed n=1 Tax=Zea mays TaxID=4577 RepID=A0A1D6MUQ0_MAIZE|nr:ATP10 protein expressed [Zea mays]
MTARRQLLVPMTSQLSSTGVLDAFGAAKNMHVIVGSSSTDNFLRVSFIDSWVLSLIPMRRAFLKAMRKSNNH